MDVTIDQVGRIVIPKTFRDRLGLAPGATLDTNGHQITASGAVVAGSTIVGTGTLRMTGGGVSLSGTVPNLAVAGDVSLDGDLRVHGDLTVDGSLHLFAAGDAPVKMGRALQEQVGQPPQIVLTMPLLEGLDGVNKMSKSLGNYIGIDEPAIDIVSKTMKIDDALMWRWFELLSFDVSMTELARMQADVSAGQFNPRDAKLRLARELAARFHDAAAAEQAIAGWHAVVRGEGDTSLLPLHALAIPAEGLRIAPLLVAAGLASSNAEASRKLKERAVRIDGDVIEDAMRVFAPGFEGVLQIGKRNFARVRLDRIRPDQA